MKRLMSVALCAMGMFGAANAQQVGKHKFINVGVKAGANFYNIRNDNGAEYNVKPGIHAGLLGHIHLTREWALQPEVVYSSQGAKYDVLGVTNTVKLGYVNVPVMVQFMFNNGFRLQAGPQVGFLVSAKNEANNNTVNIKNDFNGVDFSLGAGLGYVIPAVGLGFDARYNLGLSDINKNNAVVSQNRGFQLGLFYLFQHK